MFNTYKEINTYKEVVLLTFHPSSLRRILFPVTEAKSTRHDLPFCDINVIKIILITESYNPYLQNTFNIDINLPFFKSPS